MGQHTRTAVCSSLENPFWSPRNKWQSGHLVTWAGMRTSTWKKIILFPPNDSKLGRAGFFISGLLVTKSYVKISCVQIWQIFIVRKELWKIKFLGNPAKVLLLSKNKSSVKEYPRIQNNFIIHKIMQMRCVLIKKCEIKLEIPFLGNWFKLLKKLLSVAEICL